MLDHGVGGEDGVVRLNNGVGDLGRRIDGETELGFLAVVNGKTLQEERSETGTGSSSNGVEDEESLETSAGIGELADTVEGHVHDFLADGVVAASVVVGGILLGVHDVLGVEQFAVASGADLVNNGGLEVNENGTRHMLASAGLAEEGVEGVILRSYGLVVGHLSIGLDSVLESKQFPAGVTELATGLTNMEGDNFTHVVFGLER
jgi:hypothetical protein